MKLYQLKRKQVLPITLKDAWNFFSSPKNLEDITPPWMGFDIVSTVPDTMYAGLIIEYRIQLIAGFPMNWITEITHVDEPYFFVDEQRFGPYKFWHHKHQFREVENGVEMTDQVYYSLKGGPLGRIVHALYVQNTLKQIFDYRSDYLKKRVNEKRPRI